MRNHYHMETGLETEQKVNTVKFECVTSVAVKSLSFHSTQPWLCASLENGSIQLWDYVDQKLLHQFTHDPNEGPVNSIDIHPYKYHLLVSGGEDYNIKLWNLETRQLTLTLTGHLRKVRTVQFHPGGTPSLNGDQDDDDDDVKTMSGLVLNWILSASDDQTVRIWDFQQKSCLQVLIGHNHFVTCAAFCPTMDLVASSSVDKTVIVWDLYPLVQKTKPGTTTCPTLPLYLSYHPLKFKLTGHDREVHWVTFHPRLPLVMSAASDRNIQIWKLEENKACEIMSVTGHVHNVSCCLFHHNGSSMFLSASEDCSIRLWHYVQSNIVEAPKEVGRYNKDRFWTLAAHRTKNLVAACHNSGFLMFQLNELQDFPSNCDSDVQFEKNNNKRQDAAVLEEWMLHHKEYLESQTLVGMAKKICSLTQNFPFLNNNLQKEEDES